MKIWREGERAVWNTETSAYRFIYKAIIFFRYIFQWWTQIDSVLLLDIQDFRIVGHILNNLFLYE